MSHLPASHESPPPYLIPESQSISKGKGVRLLMWISMVGLVLLLIAVITFLWHERPDTPRTRAEVNALMRP
jgi:hypothetical protein